MDDASHHPETSLDELNVEVEALRASRARVVAAGDAARRQIERDLHDGVQQHLVALSVNLQLARQPIHLTNPDKQDDYWLVRQSQW